MDLARFLSFVSYYNFYTRENQEMMQNENQLSSRLLCIMKEMFFLSAQVLSRTGWPSEWPSPAVHWLPKQAALFFYQEQNQLITRFRLAVSHFSVSGTRIRSIIPENFFTSEGVDFLIGEFDSGIEESTFSVIFSAVYNFSAL